MDTEFTLTQKRALAIATVIAIVFGAYFLRGYFILVVVAAVAAYLFSPLYTRLNRRMGTGLSATLTLLAAFAAVIVPLSLFVFLAVVQITAMVERVAVWVQRTDLSALGDQILKWVNSRYAETSKATVYNTLNLFCERGLLRTVEVDPTRHYYDSTIDAHHHFYNVDTGEITDIPLGAISLQVGTELPPGTEQAGVEVVIRVRSR